MGNDTYLRHDIVAYRGRIGTDLGTLEPNDCVRRAGRSRGKTEESEGYSDERLASQRERGLTWR